MKWTVIGIVGLLVLVLVLLYVPPVQDFAVRQALNSLNSSGDMHLGVKRLRLSFPLRLEADSLNMMTSGMEIGARKARLKVAVLPLLKATARVEYLDLDDAIVNIGTPDSSLYMRASLDAASLGVTDIRLMGQSIDAALLEASGGKVDMVIRPDTVPPPVTDKTPVQWKINLDRAVLHDVDYGMEMLPVIASLDCSLRTATLTRGAIDLGASTIDVAELAIDSVDARYLTPTPEYIAAHPAPEIKALPDTATPSAPWTIRADRLRLTGSHAVYATEGAVPPSDYFDPSYIEASEIDLAVDSFYNRGAEITVPLRRLSTRERCGVALDLSGTFAMDSTAMYARRFTLKTPTSDISLDAMMGLDTADAPISATLAAEISPDDIRRLAPAAAQPIVQGLPPYKPLVLAADISGRMENLAIHKLSAEIPGYVAVGAEGRIRDYTDFNRAEGSVDIHGTITDGRFIKRSLFDAKTGKTFNIPPLRLSGSANLRGGKADGRLRAYTGTGKVALDASWNNRREAYDADLALDKFPIQSILPTLGAREIDASLQVNGQGLDLFSPKTRATADIDLRHATYQGRHYSGITLQAALADGHARVNAASSNPGADFTLLADGNLAGATYDWNIDGDVRHIDLRALALADTTADGAVRLRGKVSFTPGTLSTRRRPGKPMNVSADLEVPSLTWNIPGEKISATDIGLIFSAADSATDATLTNHDLRLTFGSPVPLDTLLSRLTLASSRLSADIARRRLSVDTLQRSLPPFALNMSAGKDNVIQNFLQGRDMSFRNMTLRLSNDSIIKGKAMVTQFKSGKTLLDTLSLGLLQRGDYLMYEARMDNRPGVMDQFAHVSARGYVSQDHLSLLFRQEDIQGETGYSLGLQAAVSPADLLTLRFVPYHPVIGYKNWEINKDNMISVDLNTMHVDADIDLFNDRSSLKLFTQHVEGDSTQEDLILQLKDILLQDWLAINPFMPAITGSLSADMKVRYNKPDINGAGTVSLTDLTYGKEKVGDFALDLDVQTNAAGTVRANTTLLVNGVKTITASGNLNDSTAANPFLLDFRMIRFPLSVVNPFLPRGTASLAGMLNGEMEITGSLTEPVLNGFLDFDTTKVNVAMLGTDFTFSEEKIPVKDNIVTFDGFTIKGVNDNPLRISGAVDLRSITSPGIDLRLLARNMQIVGSQKSRRSQVYGKAFIDLDAAVKGTLSFLDVNAGLNLLPGTNVTYVMTDAVSELQARSTQDMVKFVNFRDTAAVESADTVAAPSMLMNLNARLTVSGGTTIGVDLTADGKSKVQIQSEGTLNYTMDYMGDERTTGRINLNGGFVRYNIPVMGEKSFTFQEGSYIVFNGDMLAPQLNVIASDRIRANVSQSGGNNRVVNFDVLLTVTGTLEQMNVVFDLSCPDDITVANELKSMSPEQRANQAMNLLLYGSYRSGGTQTISGGNMGTNALFSFVESQLNSWASSAIKGVDLSFGINQYDKTVDGANTTAMNYSYRVSKSLFDDRFKIVVGGNYTTDANADENFAQNLIADISFEYFLNKAGTMYVRLFRHTGYESILEGEITQTGVGFVYKKKIARIADIFKFLRPRRRKAPAQQLPQQEGVPVAPPPGPTPDTAPRQTKPVPRPQRESSTESTTSENSQPK